MMLKLPSRGGNASDEYFHYIQRGGVRLAEHTSFLKSLLLLPSALTLETNSAAFHTGLLSILLIPASDLFFPLLHSHDPLTTGGAASGE